MKHCRLNFFFLLLFSLLTACTSKAGTSLKEADNLLFHNEYRAAIRLFLQIVDRYPSSPQAETALLRTGETFFLNIGEPEKAVEYFTKLTNNFPKGEKAKEAREYIALIYEETLNDYDKAVVQYQKLIEKGGLKSKDFYQFAIAQSFYKKGDYRQAIIEYEAVKKQYPRSRLITRTEYEIGNCFFVMGDCKTASKHYNNLIKKHPKNEWRSDILLTLGTCLEEKEDYAGALNIYKELEKSYPNKELIKKKVEMVIERVKDKNR